MAHPVVIKIFTRFVLFFLGAKLNSLIIKFTLTPRWFKVNDIAFHPVHGTLATVGSDGTFSFWDKDARTKLKPSEPMEQSITRCCFNHNGQIFAYSVSYDWAKVM